VDLCSAYPTIVEPDNSFALHLSPPPAAICLSQKALDAHAAAFGDHRDVRDLPEHVEVHASPRRIE